MIRRLGARRRGPALCAGALLALTLACGHNNYGAATIGLGTAVTAAGVNRAITGDCWARCSPGYGCDKQRGTCVPVECVPACTANAYCAIEADGRTRCIENLGTLPLGATPRDAGAD